MKLGSRLSYHRPEFHFSLFNLVQSVKKWTLKFTPRKITELIGIMSLIELWFYSSVYRASFPATIAEGERGEQDLGRVVFGVTVGVSVALSFFVFLKKYGKLSGHYPVFYQVALYIHNFDKILLSNKAWSIVYIVSKNLSSNLRLLIICFAIL